MPVGEQIALPAGTAGVVGFRERSDPPGMPVRLGGHRVLVEAHDVDALQLGYARPFALARDGMAERVYVVTGKSFDGLDHAPTSGRESCVVVVTSASLDTNWHDAVETRRELGRREAATTQQTERSPDVGSRLPAESRVVEEPTVAGEGRQAPPGHQARGRLRGGFGWRGRGDAATRDVAERVARPYGASSTRDDARARALESARDARGRGDDERWRRVGGATVRVQPPSYALGQRHP
jgi:hypothetical protein